jgi:hypothetical protein
MKVSNDIYCSAVPLVTANLPVSTSRYINIPFTPIVSSGRYIINEFFHNLLNPINCFISFLNKRITEIQFISPCNHLYACIEKCKNFFKIRVSKSLTHELFSGTMYPTKQKPSKGDDDMGCGLSS